jgi:hypothetical protein
MIVEVKGACLNQGNGNTAALAQNFFRNAVVCHMMVVLAKADFSRYWVKIFYDKFVATGRSYRGRHHRIIFDGYHMSAARDFAESRGIAVSNQQFVAERYGGRQHADSNHYEQYSYEGFLHYFLSIIR